MKILSLTYGNPSSYSILEDGKIVYSKVYNNQENPFEEFKKENEINDIRYFVTTFPYENLIKRNVSDYREMQHAAAINDGQIYCLGNNQAIAANSYFSSNFNKSIIVTLMDEGEEQNGFLSSMSVWVGEDNNLSPIHTFGSEEINIVRIWSNICQTVFSLPPSIESFLKISKHSESGDSEKYFKKMWQMITENHEIISSKLTRENIEEYFNLLSKNKIKAEDKNHIAAALQKSTGLMIMEVVNSALKISKIDKVCMSGLSVFNRGAIKKMESSLSGFHISDRSDIDEISCGAALYIWYTILKNKRQLSGTIPQNSRLRKMKKSELIDLSNNLGIFFENKVTKSQIIEKIELQRE